MDTNVTLRCNLPHTCTHMRCTRGLATYTVSDRSTSQVVANVAPHQESYAVCAGTLSGLHS
eukprot:7396220-Alexandrium_andersonii.AAC.1